MLRKVLVSGVVLFLWLVPHVHASVPQPPIMPTPQPMPGDKMCGAATWSKTTDSAGVTENTYALYLRKGCGPSTYHHEVGHLYDWQVLQDWHRQRFMEIYYGSARPWGAGRVQPNEVMADAYSVCAMHALGRVRWGVVFGARGLARRVEDGYYDYSVTWAQHRAICMTLWSAGGMDWRVAKPRMA